MTHTPTHDPQQREYTITGDYYEAVIRPDGKIELAITDGTLPQSTAALIRQAFFEDVQRWLEDMPRLPINRLGHLASQIADSYGGTITRGTDEPDPPPAGLVY